MIVVSIVTLLAAAIAAVFAEVSRRSALEAASRLEACLKAESSVLLVERHASSLYQRADASLRQLVDTVEQHQAVVPPPE